MKKKRGNLNICMLERRNFENSISNLKTGEKRGGGGRGPFIREHKNPIRPRIQRGFHQLF